MDFFRVVNERRSIRKWTEEEVPEEIIEKIVDAARRAPSANNSQPWSFIAVKDRGIIKEMARLVHKRMDEIRNFEEMPEALKERFEKYRGLFTFFEKAPLVMAVVSEERESITRQVLENYDLNIFKRRTIDSTEQSIAAAIENLLLATWALGYGGCWMTGPLVAVDLLEELLGIKDERHLMAVVPIGRPLKIPKYKRLRDIPEILKIVN